MVTIKIVDCANEVMPNDQDFENAYRQLTIPGNHIAIDLVYDKVESNYMIMGLPIAKDWREIFEEKIKSIKKD